MAMADADRRIIWYARFAVGSASLFFLFVFSAMPANACHRMPFLT
jgi:hypothetical protein